MLAVACEKENLTESKTLQPEEELLKSLEGDTAIADVPDVVVDDTILREQALVSQCHENLLTYTYDRSGRLDYISYIRKNTITPEADVNLVPRYAYMRDKFVYGNSGQLMELHRFSITEYPQITRIDLVKYFKYNSAGQLEQIITRRPDASYKWDRFEFLYYDQSGNMVRKLIKEPNRPTVYFSYSYDKLNRLIRIACYSNELTSLHFICDLFYDNYDNIERKEFYYPVLPTATSVNDMIRKWVVHYKYDTFNNPFKDLKLPVASLFEWMDLVSPNNIRAISFDNGSIDRMVFYKYRYNNAGYPILRYRISPVAIEEEGIKNN